MTKNIIAWPPEFLEAVLEILGEPEQVQISSFQTDVSSESRAKLVFYPQYTNFTHYKDPAKSIDREGLLGIYTEQLTEKEPAKLIEKVVWSNFYAHRLLARAEFRPGRFSAELQYSGDDSRKLLDALRSAVLACGPHRPECEIKIVFV